MTWLAPHDGSPGRPSVFSDTAIQFCLMIKVLFKLSVERLNEAHVLTQGIYSETVEYRNIDGRLVLSVEQIAEVGAISISARLITSRG